MEFDLETLADEVMLALSDIDITSDGEHLISNYQNVVGWTIRLQEIHNMLALSEITGKGGPEEKKFRTMVLDPTIERLEKIAIFESRKLTAKALEMQLDK